MRDFRERVCVCRMPLRREICSNKHKADYMLRWVDTGILWYDRIRIQFRSKNYRMIPFCVYHMNLNCHISKAGIVIGCARQYRIWWPEKRTWMLWLKSFTTRINRNLCWRCAWEAMPVLGKNLLFGFSTKMFSL
jgi:hypothetical protein